MVIISIYNVISENIKLANSILMYEKIEIVKEGNEPAKLHYQSNSVEINAKLENSEYVKLLENFRPNIGFSVPDMLIQDFVNDGSILPSFKKSTLFTNADLDEIVEPFKKDFIVSKKRRKKSASKLLNKKTKKKTNNKAKTKQTLLKKIGKKRVSNNKAKTRKAPPARSNKK